MLAQSPFVHLYRKIKGKRVGFQQSSQLDKNAGEQRN
jgi:hypothetical protein